MIRVWPLLALLLLLLPALAARAEPPQLPPKAGDVFEISRDVESSQATADGTSSGNSSDRDTLVERVVGRSEAGLELEYDLPKDTSAEDRARQWQFPASVLKPPSGPLQLLNRPELAARAAAWLKAAGLTDAACGHWIFTWNAFRIDCDPQSVIETIEGFDLGPGGLAAGALYKDSTALAPAPLRTKSATADGAVLFVEGAVDPDVIRRGRAQSDMVVAEITRRPLTLEAALRAHSGEDVSGTVATTFEIDAAGQVRRQSKVTTVNIKTPDGRVETRTVTQTMERRLVSGPGA